MMHAANTRSLQATRHASTRRSVPAFTGRRTAVRVSASSSADLNQGLGFKTMRDGVKEMAKETVLTPRFYTTDFDEMEQICTSIKDKEEIIACLEEFRTDYNKKHFVRNETFPPAAKNITGATRKIFIEFLERSCTAEFSGFLLYKELARRLKTSAPEIAEIFLLLSRDEARHAGFINKALADFNLALDLGFMTKNRTYTFFKPKFIIYATYLSEKIGYWRYISIYRHLQANPDCQLYPMFEYFENWCQDENRHGDFLAAFLKAKPELLQGTVANLWCRFFCLSVYITMYLNDHQRTAFYEALGMNTKKFNQHVIIETNNSTERVFPQVPNVDTPLFWQRMDKLVDINTQLIKMDQTLPGPVASVAKMPLQIMMVSIMAQLFFETPKNVGSVDLEKDLVTQY